MINISYYMYTMLTFILVISYILGIFDLISHFFCIHQNSVVLGPERMITVPPRHFCIIENPVVRNKDNEIVLDASGQARLSHADQDIRIAQEPFPLWPGEVLKQPITPLKVVVANTALRLKAVLDFETDDGEKRTAGDEYLFEGPG